MWKTKFKLGGKILTKLIKYKNNPKNYLNQESSDDQEEFT